MKSDIRVSFSLRDRDLAAEGLILLEGSFLVERALASGLEMCEILCVPKAAPRWDALASGRCPVRTLTEGEISALAGYPFHRGVLALARRPVLREIRGAADIPGGNILCLHQVSDGDNLGALIRSGAALGIDAVVLGPGCADPFYRKVLRSSMGASFCLPLYSLVQENVNLLFTSGLLTVAAALGGASLEGIAVGPPAEKKPICLFLGNEGWGLPEEIVSACELKIEIPMSGKTDSLNVASAGAILMWELLRKRE